MTTEKSGVILKMWNPLTTEFKKGVIFMEKLSVKAIRVNIGKTQKEMANLLGISTRKYADKENGLSKWYWDEIKKISEIADIEIKRIS